MDRPPDMEDMEVDPDGHGEQEHHHEDTSIVLIDSDVSSPEILEGPGSPDGTDEESVSSGAAGPLEPQHLSGTDVASPPQDPRLMRARSRSSSDSENPSSSRHVWETAASSGVMASLPHSQNARVSRPSLNQAPDEVSVSGALPALPALPQDPASPLGFIDQMEPPAGTVAIPDAELPAASAPAADVTSHVAEVAAPLESDVIPQGEPHAGDLTHAASGGDLEIISSENLPPVAAEQTVTAGPSSSQEGALHATDRDFQSPKRTKVPSPNPPPATGGAGDSVGEEEEEGQSCPICFEHWTNSGKHRLAALKCGHLFGQSCIEKWLKGQGGKCPQCNAKANRKDIRVIYAKSLKVVDTSERDRALRDLDQEKEARRKVELEAAQVRMRYMMAIDECNKLRQDLDCLRSTSKPLLTSGSPQKPSNSQKASGSYALEKHVKIWDAGGCRVLAYSPGLAILCVSQPSASPLFPGFGVKKLSTLDFKTAQYVSIHTKMIRDVAFNPNNPDGLLLSVSMDKTVKITSILSSTVVQTYDCGFPVWSCAWDMDDANYFFAGLGNGTVNMFDVRNTADHVMQLNTEGSRSPVVSLQTMQYTPNKLFRPGGVLVGQLDRSMCFEKKSADDFMMHALPIEGNVTSLSLEEGTRHVLATYRPNARLPLVRHVMYELSFYNKSEDPTCIEHGCRCHSVQAYHGGGTQKILSRSRLVPTPLEDGRLLVCAGDEASNSVHIWDATTNHLKQKLSLGAPIIDLCAFTANDTHLMAALSDKQVSLLRWR